MFIAGATCGVMSARVAALCSSWSLLLISKGDGQLWTNLDDRWVLIVMKRPKITTVELYTFHLQQHYSLFTHYKLQYARQGDYCESAQSAQLIASLCSLPNLLRVCAACPSPRLNLRFELLPSWNDIHDTFPTGTTQDKIILCILFKILKYLRYHLSESIPLHKFTRQTTHHF
jgi:hypothetical protein